MTIRNLDALFKPESVALIGASPKPGSMGAVLVKNLLGSGFSGRIMLVNPRHKEIEGTPCYADIGKLPEVPDLAIIAIAPAGVPKLVAKLGRRGTRAVVIFSTDAADMGLWQGKKLQQQLLDAAKPHLLRIIGPDGLGILLPELGINASSAHVKARPGKLALVTRSGAIVASVLDWAQTQAFGFSHIVSLGDMCDVDFGDMLNYLADDPDTDAILLYLEAVTGARKFMSAARAAARSKPVVVLKTGRFRTSRGAAASHSGALVSSDAVFDAVFRRTGLLRVYSIEELFAAAETLSSQRRPVGDRLAIVTNGSGVGMLAADALGERGGRLAELSQDTIEHLEQVLPAPWSRGNPLDIADASARHYADTLAQLSKDAGVDAVLLVNCPSAMASSLDAARAVIDAVASQKRRSFDTSWVAYGAASEAVDELRQARIPCYETQEKAVRAFMHVVNYHQGRELLIQTPPSIPEQFAPDLVAARELIDTVLNEQRSWMTEPEAKGMLAAYGIPVVSTRIAHSAEQAGAIASEMGCNVVLKIVSPQIGHKSDVGGVALDLYGASAVSAAAQTMLERLRKTAPEARISGFTVQPMVKRAAAYELFIGMVDHRQFGPVLLFGQGGTAVEVIDDKALGLPPLNMRLARELISRTRVHRLLSGFRDRPTVDMDAIALTLIKVGQMIIDHPEIVELDINPLLADAAGVMALDARIRVAVSSAPATHRLAIKPYPKELEASLTLDDDRSLLIRPIVPEDEPAIHDGFAQLTPTEIYQRFFTPMKSMSHLMAARFTQLDYDRDMALVLTEPGIPGTTAIYGVVQLAADPDRYNAEFAIILGQAMTGKGLGKAMMQHLIDYARQRDIKTLYGDVLRSNDSMLGLSRALGFTQSDIAGDDSIVRVTLVL